MKGIRYISLAVILLTAGCAISNQFEPEPTIFLTNDVANLASPTPQESLPTIIPTPIVRSADPQEPVLAAKFVFPGDYLKISDLYFIDENNGWAIGRLDWYDTSISSITCCKPIIFNTTDGGRNWKEVNTGISSGILNSIVFIDSTTAYAVGQEFFYGIDTTIAPNIIVLKTIDGGDSWSQVDKNRISGALLQVTTTDNQQIWSVGMGLNGPQSLILRSADGLFWEAQKHPSVTSGKLVAIDFPSDEVGYAVGYIGLSDVVPYIIKTFDAGNHWEVLSFPSQFGRLLDVTFLDEVNGYVIGQFGETSSIATTSDGGENWTFKNLDPDIEPSWFTESNNRFIVFGNCWHSWACNNLIGLFDGNEFIPFETLALPNETITAVGNPMNDGSISFVTNTKPENSYAKYETTFYRYYVP